MLLLNTFDIVYLLTSILGTYTVFRFMRICFKKPRYAKIYEMISYLSYLTIGNLLFLVVRTPIIMMIFNLVSFFALTWNYCGKLKKRLLTAIYAYLFLFCIEMVIVSLTGYIRFSVWHTIEFHSIFTVVSVKIISYAAVLCTSKIWKLKEGESIPLLYWLCIIFIPIASLSLLLIVFSSLQICKLYIVVSVVLILLINFLVFYLYDSMIVVLAENVRRLSLEQQNIYYKRQLELMQSSIRHTQLLKHDMKNHLLMLKALHDDGKQQKSIAYIGEVLSKLKQAHEYVNTGNIEIDSILNFKLAEAASYQTQINTDINIPDCLTISTFTLTTILGNLMDNAIRAVKNTNGKREIGIKIVYNKGNLIFHIENTFDGNLRMQDGHLITTKSEKKNHGMGLKNVKAEVEKCNGEILIEYTDDVFSVTVLLNSN